MAQNQQNALYDGLRALQDMLFPKRCRACGKTFESFEQYLEETQSIGNSSGLTTMPHNRNESAVGVFRNCLCGSTLLVPCHNRRSTKPDDEKRRTLFGKLLEDLERRNWKRIDARKQLLKFMRGEDVQFQAPPPDTRKNRPRTAPLKPRPSSTTA